MSDELRFGRIEVRPALRQIRVDGKPVVLGSRAFDVLMALIERRDRLVSKEELMDTAWAGVVVEQNNLSVQISAFGVHSGPMPLRRSQDVDTASRPPNPTRASRRWKACPPER
jgi:hypothetical protein